MIEKIQKILAPLFDEQAESAFRYIIERGGSRTHAMNAAAKAERERTEWYAKEILKALETPTPAMIEAGQDAVDSAAHIYRGYFPVVFTAMKRAAREQGDA